MAIPATWVMFCEGTNLKDLNESDDTMYFADEAARNTFFESKAIAINSSLRVYNISYQRNSGGTCSMKVEVPYSVLFKCDYLVYCNTGHENRSIYCFVDTVNYVNDAVTEVIFHEDPLQTWIRSTFFNMCHVDRRLPSTDVLFAVQNNIGDSFTSGDHHIVYSQDITSIINENKTLSEYAVMVLNKPLYVQNGEIQSEVYNMGSMRAGQPESAFYYIAKLTNGSNMTKLSTLMKFVTSSDTYKSAFLAMYVSPAICLPQAAITQEALGPTVICASGGSQTAFGDWTLVKGYVVKANYENFFILFRTFKNLLFDGYVPKNKKMYNAPCWFMRIKNNCGDSFDLLPQYLMNLDEAQPQLEENIAFGGSYYGVMSASPQVVLYPAYDNERRNTNYCVNIKGYPQIPTTSDEFLTWFQQLRLNAGSDIMRAVTGTVSSFASASMAGMTAKNAATRQGIQSTALMSAGLGSVTNIANAGIDFLQNYKVMKNSAPITSGNINAQETTTALTNDHFTVEIWSIPYAEAKATDDNFSRYGYNVDSLMRPENGTFYNLNNRQHFTYIKTSDVSVQGDVPIYAQRYIEGAFNKGLRIWNPSSFLDYYLTNGFVN